VLILCLNFKQGDHENMQDQIRILGIAPYVGLKELMQEVAAQRSDIDLEVYVGDLADGVRLALEHQRRGFSVIISRGGTAETIRRVASIPVVEVNLSVYDVLRAIKLAQNYGGKFAIVGFPSITNCAKILCDLLRYMIDIVTVNSREEVEACLQTLKRKGCSMVLGDMVTTVSAKIAGLNGILITSGGESVESAFDHAAEIYGGRGKNLEEIEFLDALLLAFRDELIVFDENCEVRTQLSANGSLPDEGMLCFMKKNVSSVLKRGEIKILRRRADEELITLLGRSFSTRSGRYCAFTLTRVPASHVYDGQGVTFQNKAELMEDVSNIFCRSNSVGKFAGMVEKYSSSDLPVLILGEIGTGKDKTANSIYIHGKLCDHPMVTIDCALVGEKKWNWIFENEYSPFQEEKFTIYIKNTNQLSEPLGARLVRYFQEAGVCERNRVIFSFVARHNAEAGKSQLCEKLKNDLSCLVIRLTPLRQRLEDIPSLCSLYINEINASSGKSVVGLTPEATTLMREYHWENNLNQLRRVLAQLVTLSDAPYISADEVAEALAAESDPVPIGHDLNLNRPLGDIARDIAWAVLREEGMNRSKTARRLGISRSTLWKMLAEKTPNNASAFPCACAAR
jgi:transcriptional regulator with PAS, ATPase and Fis domain